MIGHAQVKKKTSNKVREMRLPANELVLQSHQHLSHHTVRSIEIETTFIEFDRRLSGTYTAQLGAR